MNGIDETIAQVEKLYQTVTGKQPPPADTPYAPIPAEKDPIRQVEAEIERLMQLLTPTPVAAAAAGAAPATQPENQTWIPALQVFETQTEVLFCLDLPGCKREQVEVLLQNSTLIVRGQRLSPLPPQTNAQTRLLERPLGHFQRVLPLPIGARQTGYTAQLKDGVLEIKVPREQSPRSEPIPVT